MGHREHFRDVEFERWAYRIGLGAAEEFLFERYLDPRRSTVEAGTGGGCILHALRERGHERLHGFDCVPELIDVARRRDWSGSIDFTVQDAVRLEFPDGAFEQAVYLTALCCFIEDPAACERAVGEAYRILAPGGVALFSFLSWEGRVRRAGSRAFAAYLGALRLARRDRRPLQVQPWLRRRGRPNLRALLDAAPHVRWFRVPEAVALVERAGFRVAGAGWTRQLARGQLEDDPRALRSEDADTTLYLACRKEALQRPSTAATAAG